MVLLAGLAVATQARAEVVMRAPAGWELDRDGAAQARARAWLSARTDARIVLVYTPIARDAFAETLALVELDGAFQIAAPAAQELARALSGLPGFDVNTAVWSRAVLEDGTPRLRTTWEHEQLAYRAELVPSGATRTVLLQATLVREASLYVRTFEETTASIAGAALPKPPFDRSAWRTPRILIGGLVVAAIAGLALWRRPLGASASVIGRIVAAACVVAAAIAAGLTLDTTAAQDEQLRLAGLTARTLAGEVVTYGLTAAVVTWALGMWLGGRERPIASAPQRGAFADRSGASLVSVPILPKVPAGAAAPKRRHPDGPSRLERVTSPPGGGLEPVDPVDPTSAQ